MINRPFALLTLIFLGTLWGCQQSPSPAPDETPPPLVSDTLPDHAWATLDGLLSAEPPPADLNDLVGRLTTTEITPPTQPQHQEGDTHTFWYKRDAAFNERIDATLAYQSDMLNLWIAEGAKADAKKLREAAAHLENELLPTTRATFGTEAQPGIDGDSRLTILHLAQIGSTGSGVAAVGYFSSGDLVSASVNQYSNEREMLYVGLKQGGIATPAYYDTIAHELQHLIHTTVDQNEYSWVDEGLADLAIALNDGTLKNVPQFAKLTDVQLNNWSQGTHEDLPHYGASYLFNQYVYDRFGDEAIKQVIENGDNGFRGYASMLTAYGMTVEQFFGDWVAANYLTSIGRSTPPYQYASAEIPTLPTETLQAPATISSSVKQYGTDYVKITADAPVTLSFTGSTVVPLLAVEPYSGDYFWTTYPADRSDMSLTRRFDLSETNATTATLEFQTWYEIEEGWDYGYVTVSADDGDTWQTLADPFYATSADPQGYNYGYAYTGNSGAGAQAVWTPIRIDLSDYIGRKILLRFEYVTDQAVYRAGWAIDDIAIPESGYC